MNKQEFLDDLRNALAGLPQDDIEERISFYNEMIDDSVEEGMTEEEAVAKLRPIDEIRSETVADIPLTKLVKEKVKPERKLRTWEIVLIILGFPLWCPLLLAAFAVALSLYITVWSLIISLWAVELSLCVCALGGVVCSIIYFFHGDTLPAVAMLGAGLFSAGLSVFMFFGCKAATKGILKLTKKAALAIKKLFVKKERVQ